MRSEQKCIEVYINNILEFMVEKSRELLKYRQEYGIINIIFGLFYK